VQTKASTKPRYRLRNWKEYNAALVRRGSLTFWIDEEVLKRWRGPAAAHRGRRRLLSEEALQALFMLQSFFRLPLRALEGLCRSILTLLEVNLPVPDYSTLCRRRQTLEGQLLVAPCSRGEEPMHLVIDASGLKVFGEGEWKVRQHGVGKRRTWRKLHLAVDEKSAEIVAAAASGAEVADGHALPVLLAQVDSPIGAGQCRWRF
jgi:Transposase DDE domain